MPTEKGSKYREFYGLGAVRSGFSVSVFAIPFCIIWKYHTMVESLSLKFIVFTVKLVRVIFF